MTDGPPQDHPDFVPTARPIPLAQATDVPAAMDPLIAPSQSDSATHPLYLTQSTRGSTWIDIAVLVTLVLLSDLLVGGVLFFVLGYEDDKLYLLPTVVLRMFFLPTIVVLILRFRGQRAGSVGMAYNTLGLDILIGMITPAVTFGVVLVVMGTIWLAWPNLFSEMQRNAETIIGHVPKLSTLGFAILAAMVGFYEELVFRGFLLTRFRRATGNWTIAVFLSSLLFVAPHAMSQVPIALVPVTILSITFSLVTIWRKSLIPAIVGHVLWNFFQFINLSYQAGDAWK